MPLKFAREGKQKPSSNARIPITVNNSTKENPLPAATLAPPFNLT
jgi:hypothetical protein